MIVVSDTEPLGTGAARLTVIFGPAPFGPLVGKSSAAIDIAVVRPSTFCICGCVAFVSLAASVLDITNTTAAIALTHPSFTLACRCILVPPAWTHSDQGL